MARRADMRAGLLAAIIVSGLVLAGCGKKGPPQPPGPPDQITWPRNYPTR
jgi:predicted small lipoprotein YifL